MTKAEMLTAIRAAGMTCRVSDGEIRVNFPRGGEATAYYTTDRDDAADTARAMARERVADDDDGTRAGEK